MSTSNPNVQISVILWYPKTDEWAYNRRCSIMNAIVVSELRLCVLNTSPSESIWWRLYTNHRTGFSDEMRMTSHAMSRAALMGDRKLNPLIGITSSNYSTRSLKQKLVALWLSLHWHVDVGHILGSLYCFEVRWIFLSGFLVNVIIRGFFWQTLNNFMLK